VLFDVDHFKVVNDTYGHQIGDEVLVRLSLLISSASRGVDLLARWGGEEFVILATGTDGSMASQFAEKLRAVVERAEFGVAGSVTCSFGVAEYAEGDSARTFVARADSALYKAKANGRNRVEFASGATAAIGRMAQVS
jgi:diguanylate cyclase (GGDEF)-like protein